MDFPNILNRSMEISTSKRYLTIYGVILGFIEFFIGWSVYVYEIVWLYYAYGSGDGHHIGQKEIMEGINYIITHFQDSIFIVSMIIILFLVYLFIPPFLTGGIIGSINRMINEHPVGVFESISFGIRHYIKLLEYEALMSFASVPKILFLSYAIHRFLGGKFSTFVYVIMAVLLIIVILINILTAYAPYYIVIKNESLFMAIAKSINTVIMYLRDSFFIFAISGIVVLRVILNILLFLILPVLLVTLFMYLSQYGFLIGLSISIFIGVISLVFILWISGRFIIFSFAFWTLSLYEIEKKDETYKLLDGKSSSE